MSRVAREAKFSAHVNGGGVIVCSHPSPVVALVLVTIYK